MPRAAINPFHDLCRISPDKTLSLILHAAAEMENPEYALAALEDAHEHLRDGIGGPGHDFPAYFHDKIRNIAGLCAFSGPESIERLGRMFPEIWRDEAIVDDVFRNLADGLSCCGWECEDDQGEPLATRCSHASSLARGWIGAGLNGRAWARLAEAGGPLFKAFVAEHAQTAKDNPSQLPSRREIFEISAKAFARLRKATGLTGYGRWGSWPDMCASDFNINATNMIAIKTGLGSLFAEISGAGASPNGAGQLLAARLAQALADSTRQASSQPGMARLVLSAAKRSLAAGVSLGDMSAEPYPHLGMPIGRKNLIKISESLPLPVIFALSAQEDIRTLGFALGATADMVSNTWGEAMRAARGRGAASEETMALVEARILGAVSDEALFAQGGKPRKSSAMTRL